MRPRVLLAVDLSYQCYRAAAAHPGLTDADGRFTGGLYGFFASFAKAVRETGATHAIGCLDVKPYLRSRDYPEYKMIRKASANEELRELQQETLPMVIELLERLGVPVWGVPGFESDDLIAHCVVRHRSRFAMVYGQTNDSDLFQHLDKPNFALYTDDMKTLKTRASLHDLFGKGVTPAEHMLISALTGTHNDIAGIDGVGPVRALAATRDPAVMRRYRNEHAALIDRNLELIRLPHRELPNNLALPRPTAGCSPRELYRFLARSDIDCTGSMVNALDQLRG